ncbi:hypothetical protein M3Y97_00097900 [Aphelenchoides bicaudatus]|nr:hypothetical protein M3Y97_00097900 [Aphelenchoides bicaudatus]
MGTHRKTKKKRTLDISPRSFAPEESEFRLPPENDLGNVEYKAHLVDPSAARLNHLATQMRWRLNEGHGQAIYELGVLDDGQMYGLEASDLEKTLETMQKMSNICHASLFVLNERVVHGNPNDSNCRRVIEVLVKKLPEDQPFVDTRVALLGSASSGKSTLCGTLSQGELDNGKGSSRLNFLRFLHEIRSGKTSSITMDCFGFSADGEILNYKKSDLKGILDRSAKLITMIDLAGDKKFLKTTIHGLSGYAPDYCAILINSKIGWNAMTDEHLTIANAFKIPVFFAITKIDLVKPERVEKIISQIQAAIEKSHKHLKIKHVLNEEDCINSAQSIGDSTLPIFSLSNVTGENLDLLTKFLNLLPNRNVLSAGSETQMLVLFSISTKSLICRILCGLVGSGVFNEADQVQIGPDSSGNYRLASIKSIRRNKQPVLKIHSGEAGSISVEFTNGTKGFTIRKGMVVVSKHDFGICCRKFKARFQLISHSSDEIFCGFQGVAYIGSLRRAVTIASIEEGSIRLGEWCTVTFEFYGGPEFIQVGNRIFFKSNQTNGIGEIIEIPDS